MSTRKRPIASDPEEDELSPAKSSKHKDIFGTAKKRKLNTTDSPLSSRTSASKSGLIGSLSGLFGYGKRRGTEKENALVEDEDIDELGVEPDTETAKKDVWDVPDEDDPPISRPSSIRKQRGKTKTPNKTTIPAKESRITTVDGEDEEDIEEELPKIILLRKQKGRTSVPKSTTKLAEKKAMGVTPKRGRPKRKLIIPTEEPDEEDIGEEGLEAIPQSTSKIKSNSKLATKLAQRSPYINQKAGQPKHRIEVDFDAVEDGEEEFEAIRIPTTENKSAANATSKSMHIARQVTPKKARRGIDTEVEAEVADSNTEDNEVEIPAVIARPKSAKAVTSNTRIREDGTGPQDTPRRGRPRKDGLPPGVPRSTPKSSRSKQDLDPRDTSKSNDGSTLGIGQRDQITASPSRSKRGLRKSEIHKKAKQLSREAAREAMSRAILKEDQFEAEGNNMENLKLPKGILTPSGKKRGPKPRKSVIFQDIEELDLGFKDIPDSSNKKKADAVEATAEVEVDTSEAEEDVEGEANSDQSDEIACAVCSGLDETKFNKIVLCDGCDFAVHQVCYDLPKVPRGDWYCKPCQSRQETLLSDPITTHDFSSEIPDIEGFEYHLRIMQTLLLSRLTGNTRMRLHGHDDEMEKVHQVVKQTVLAGEGNSMLVIGARGSGKTTLVDAVIDDLYDHRESFHVVKLNGFIHTDDKLALKDIWRQLGREMEIEDDSKATANDTLQSLLALLSHPSELVETEEGHTTKSVVFILDEFDLFTTHPRQTLLYNLFDIAQARKAPIVVLGLTTRVDVAEALEKRVKSRFSHRYVHLSLPQSIVGFEEICRNCLTANIEDLEAAGFNVGAKGMEDFVSLWQNMINDLYQDAAFKHHVETHFYRTKSVPEFLTSCILPVANLSTKNFPLRARAFLSHTISLLAPDSKLHILQGLSELELAMLIAAARLDIILDTDTCNFAMAYDEYCSLTSRHKIQTSSSGITALGAGAKVWGREVALGAWERLAEYDILVPAGVGGAAARDLGAGGRMWKVDVGLDEIAGSVAGLSSVMMKWCREI